MKETTFQGWLTAHTREFMIALLLIQPLLDVLSYFMQNTGTTEITTVLRMVLLIVVSLYGYGVSNRKRTYHIVYGVILLYWVFHMLNCIRTGYAQPVADVAEFLKLVQFPLWTLSFISFFRCRADLNFTVVSVLAVNLVIILLVIFLSFASGNFVYTYNYPERGMEIGVLGWFGIPNSQSAVLAMIVPAVLLWAYRTQKLWVFSLFSLLGLGLLYFTGTRLTYFAALIIAAAFTVLIVWNRGRIAFCIPILAILVMLLVFRSVSPMEERQNFSENSNTLYQQKTDAVMGEDRDFEYKAGQEIPAEIEKKIETLYTEVYGVPGPHGIPLLEDLIEKYGLSEVMKVYNYTVKPEILYHSRVRKLKAMELNWNHQDFLTKLLGFEYSDATINGNIYDPENDFPALKYYYGYLGAGLYWCFILYFIVISLIHFFKNWRTFLTLEFGTAAIMFAFALGAAQFSGQVLRRPNVCVYFSLAAAIIYHHIYMEGTSDMLYYHRRRSVVETKRY